MFMRRRAQDRTRIKSWLQPGLRTRLFHGGRVVEHLRAGLVVGLLIGLIVSGIYWFGWLERTELQLLDLRFTVRFLRDGLDVEQGPIVVVAIDERSLNAVGRWPWPWREQARLIDALTDAGVRAIGLDTFHTEVDADDEGLAEFASALRRSGRVVLAAAGNAQVPHYPVEPLVQAAAGVGLTDVVLDRDGVIRRLDTRRRFSQPEPFAFVLARVAGAAPDPVWSEQPFLINYRPVSAGARLAVDRLYETVSAIDVMNGIIREPLHGKVAIVGLTAHGFQDRHTTPLLASVPGAYLHAFALRSLLVDDYINLSQPWVAYVLLWVVALVGSTAAFTLRPWVLTAAAFLAFSGSVWTAFAAFVSRGLWVPLTPLIAAGALVFVSGLVYAHSVVDRDTRRIRSLFRRYVPPEVVDRLLQDAGSVEAGKRATVTVLFADIRGFTSFAEQVTPEEAVATLDRYLQVMADAILRHGGTLDKYIGDAVMAIFGAPLARADHAEAAVRTALQLRREVAALGENIGQDGERLLIGIGVHSGEAVVGSIGASNRREYTAIGDVVNVASRLEEAAAPGEILLSKETLTAWGAEPPSESIRLAIRGRKDPIVVYRLPDGFSLDDTLAGDDNGETAFCEAD